MTTATRTLTGMAPLTRSQIEDRLREIDNAMASDHAEYVEAATNKARAIRDRELLIAQAFARIDGQPTVRRQLAIAEVGEFGKDADVLYAKMAAHMEVLHDRAMIGASLLKSAKAEDAERRYADGP